MPAKQSEANDAVALLQQAGLRENAVIYELGSGWGTLAIALAKAFPKAQVNGIELSPIPFLVARFRTRNMPNVHFKRANFYNCDLRDADAITCYLMIKPMPKLVRFLDRVLRRGTPVVAVTFWFRDRQPVAVRKGSGIRGDVALYVWDSDRAKGD